MTFTQNLRTRLRRAALYSILSVTASGLLSASPHKVQADESGVCCPPSYRTSHRVDSPDLCGWIDDLSNSARQPDPVESQTTEVALPQFLSIDFDQELNIDTCNYGRWLADAIDSQLATSEARETVADSIASTSGPASEDVDNVCVSTNVKQQQPATKTASASAASLQTPAHQTSSDFNSALATLAAAATAGNHLPFGPWSQPIAMAGPGGNHAAAPATTPWERWIEKGQQLVDQLRESESIAQQADEFVPLVDFAGELDSQPADSNDGELLALKTAGTGSSVLVSDSASDSLKVDVLENSTKSTTASAAAKPSISISESRRSLVGSSPMIASVKEAYLPYDLAERDRDPVSKKYPHPSGTDLPLVWNDGLLVPANSPFCIHLDSPLGERRWSPLRSRADRRVTEKKQEQDIANVHASPAVSTTTALDSIKRPAEPIESPNHVEHAATPDPFLAGSADCILDEWVWNVRTAIEDAELTENWLHPKRIGQDVASLVVSGDRLASRIASQLALVWPAKQRPAKPAPGIGARLLARAEAVERPAAEPLPARELPTPEQEVQLAQARATLMQWVDAAQSVIEDWNRQLTDVPEIAQEEGFQADSVRR